MKSKSIFIILFLAMFLNIFHDFTIEHQVDIDCCSKIELFDKSDDCQKVDILHHFFHFFALELILEDIVALSTQTKPIFDTQPPAIIVLQTSFKPPKV